MPPHYNTTYGSVPRNESGYMMFKTLRRVSPERSLSFWFRRMWVVALRARLVKCNKGASNTIRLNTRVPKSWTDAKGILNSFSDLLLVCANAHQCTDENDMVKWQHLSAVYIRLFLNKKVKKCDVHLIERPQTRGQFQSPLFSKQRGLARCASATLPNVWVMCLTF